MTSCEEEDFTVEVLGILGNLTFPEIDFEKVVTELDLLPFISTKLKVHTRCSFVSPPFHSLILFQAKPSLTIQKSERRFWRVRNGLA